MKRTTFLLTLLSITFFAFQTDLLAQAEMSGDQSKGQIIVKGKKTEDGIIELQSLNDPWENQRTVRYIDEKTFKKGKVKKKDWEKYKPKDIEGYKFGDRVFVTEKYTAIGGAIQAADVNKVTAVSGAIGSLSKNAHFMELVLDGEVKVYRFYNYPPEASVQSGSSQIDAYQETLNDLRTYYEVLVKVGKKGKVENFKNIKVEELLADCEEVKTKYMNKEYSLKPTGMNKLMKLGGGGFEFEQQVIELIKDYNDCKK